MNRFDTVVFDLDGTLLNTLEDLTDSVNFSLSNSSLPLRTMEEVRSSLGNGAKSLIEMSVPDGQKNPLFSKCLVEFQKHYKKNLNNKTTPYPGIIALLKKLHDINIKIAVVSNKFDEAVKMLNQQFFKDYINVAIGESKGIPKKPSPDMIYKALKELSSTKDRALFVGDSETDAKTGKNSSLVFVGVTWGFRDREILINEGSNYIIDKPEELLKIIVSQ